MLTLSLASLFSLFAGASCALLTGVLFPAGTLSATAGSFSPGLFLHSEATSVAQVFEDQGIRAKQAEARQYVGALNRSQQAQYLERRRFSTNFKELGVWFQPETANYRYRSVLISVNRLGMSAVNNQAVMNLGTTKRTGLKSYAGIVWAVSSDRREPRTFAVLCESNSPTAKTPGLPNFQGDGTHYQDVTCPAGYTLLR